MPVRMVMLPPTANPNVTAGFKWPPEIFAATETPTNSANAWATATATKPGGSKAASEVSLSTHAYQNIKFDLIYIYKRVLFLKKFKHCFKGGLLFNTFIARFILPLTIIYNFFPMHV